MNTHHDIEQELRAELHGLVAYDAGRARHMIDQALAATLDRQRTRARWTMPLLASGAVATVVGGVAGVSALRSAGDHVKPGGGPTSTSVGPAPVSTPAAPAPAYTRATPPPEPPSAVTVPPTPTVPGGPPIATNPAVPAPASAAPSATPTVPGGVPVPTAPGTPPCASDSPCLVPVPGKG